MTLPFDIPRLETDRLILRAPSEADLPAVMAFSASDRSRFVGGPYEPPQVWRGFLGMIGHWALRGYGWWTIEHKATGQAAGRTGVSFHIGYPEPELGWHIYDGFEGQGYAYEAAKAARAHACANLGLGPLISMIDPENVRSKALAARLGATFKRMGTIDAHICEIWRHPARPA